MEVSDAYYAMAGIYSMVNFFEQEGVKSLGTLVSSPPFLPVPVAIFESYPAYVAGG